QGIGPGTDNATLPRECSYVRIAEGQAADLRQLVQPVPVNNSDRHGGAEVAGELLERRAEAGLLRHVAVQRRQPAVSDQALQEAPIAHEPAQQVFPGCLIYYFREEENGG